MLASKSRLEVNSWPWALQSTEQSYPSELLCGFNFWANVDEGSLRWSAKVRLKTLEKSTCWGILCLWLKPELGYLIDLVGNRGGWSGPKCVIIRNTNSKSKLLFYLNVKIARLKTQDCNKVFVTQGRALWSILSDQHSQLLGTITLSVCSLNADQLFDRVMWCSEVRHF